MNDLDCIREIERIFGFKLNHVKFERLFEEESFNVESERECFRNYSTNSEGIVNGLALDFCPIYRLPDGYLGNFVSLEKLSLKSDRFHNHSFLRELKSLTVLNLCDTRIWDYSFFGELRSLTVLDLRNNQINDASFLSELKALTKLDLRNNEIKDASFLSDLRSLTILYLSGNGISDASFLRKLTLLTTLYLSGNGIRDPSFLSDLKSLTTLDLSYNKIKNWSFLDELKSLTALYLSGNGISDASFLSELEALTTLYLSSNGIRNASFLGKLKSLTTLDLSNNDISDGSFLGEMKALTELNLRYNQIGDASFLGEMKALVSLRLDKNPIVNPPKEIIAQGISAIRNYFEQVKEQGVDRIYEAKMLIVGEPGAGKSTLFEKIKDPKYLPQNASKDQMESTVGIRIGHLSFDYIKDKTITFKAHLWDFGGQPIQYILHQYFFTERSLYVLVADDRRQLTNFPYWFEIIGTLGRNCPVLVVLNELNHKSVTNFDLAEYQREFSDKVKTIDKNDVDFSSNDGRFAILKTQIENALCNLEHIGQELPKTWVTIREEIEKESREIPYIEINRYHEICAKYGVEEKYRPDILRYFHDLGIALNYEADENLEDIVILDPNWVIDALYVVLKNTDVKANAGRFHKDFVFDLWIKENYRENRDHKFLLRLMQRGKFEVAYKIGNTSEYIVPALLPFETPDYVFAEKNVVQVYFQYTFMPPGILSRLIVRLNENIIRQEGHQIVWERGVLLERETAIAEVIELHHKKRQITIRVSGDNFVKNKEFLTVIRNELRKIHKDWFDDRLSFEERVYCICDKCRKSESESYTLEQLEGKLVRGKNTIECRKSDEHVNVRQLLDGVYIEEKSSNEHSDSKFYIANININVAGGDMVGGDKAGGHKVGGDMVGGYKSDRGGN